MFEELNSQELMATEGGSFLGFLAAGAIIIGTATIVACAVVLVGKVAQKFSDWIG